MGKSKRRNTNRFEDGNTNLKNDKPRRQNRKNVVNQIVQQQDDEYWEDMREFEDRYGYVADKN